MQLTINVSDQISARAEAQGLAPESYAEQVIDRDLQTDFPKPANESVHAAIVRLKELRKRNFLNGLSIKDLMNEGRKY